VLLAAAFAMTVSACGVGRPSVEEAAVEVAIQQTSAALAAGDVEAFVDHWTDDGLQQVFAESTETFARQSGYYVQARQWALGPPSQTEVSGTTATSIAPLFFRLVGAPRRFSMVREAGTWKIDGAELTTTDVGDARVVDVILEGSSIDLDASAIVDGDIALDVRNGTSDVHELNIITVPKSRDMAAFFAHPELEPPLPEGRSMPDGMDFIGGINRLEPGARVTVLFQQPLPPGRYVLFCNVEDPSGRPHARLGEYIEFTVE